MPLTYGNCHCIMAVGGHAVRVLIDRFGRIVVPKEIREAHGIEAGSEIELLDTGEGILLRPAEENPGLVEKEGILVFRARATGDVESAVREQRARRLARAGAARG